MRIAYGGWKLGGHGWGHVDEQKGRKTIEVAIQEGIVFYDTAPVYGFGRSEELLGEILQGESSVYIASKCGLVWDDSFRIRHDLSRDAVLRDIEGSLFRLKRDRIDLYQVHWPDPKIPLSQVLRVLTDLKRQQMIGDIGICNYPLAQVKECLKEFPITSLQYKYNFLEREVEKDILPFCEEKKLNFLAYSPLGQGILSGEYSMEYSPGKKDVRRWNPLFSDLEIKHRALAKVQELPEPKVKNALGFLLKNVLVSRVLISTTNPKHLRENIKYYKEIIQENGANPI